MLGPKGKILAIEPIPQNADVLRRNVEINGLGSAITVVECGVWNKCGRMPIFGDGETRFALTRVDQMNQNDLSFEVETNTLDELLKKWDEPKIDFLDIRVNGAEAEVIEGLDTEAHRVDIIFVATPYSQDGVSARTTCERLLLERGFSVIPPSNSGMIYARNENHQTK